MSSRATFRFSLTSRTTRVVAASFLGIGTLGGCAEPWYGSRVEQVTYPQMSMAPGVTRACYADPCSVLFTLPTGADSYTVRANDRVLGTFPAGQSADLGVFYRQDSPVTITVDGIERSAAVLYLLEQQTY